MAIKMTDDEFHIFQKLIYDETGISLADGKKDLLISRLARRFIDLNVDSFADYYQVVTTDHNEFMELVDRVSTHMTEFFREQPHFDFFEGRFIKEMERRSLQTGRRKITAWSVACSTGEEPYSIAMSILENLAVPVNWEIKILASDISNGVLEQAKNGLYTDDRMKDIPKYLWNKYFLKGTGVNAGNFKVKNFLRDIMIFRRFNLLDSQWPIRGGFDAIFCRNVLIYFDKEMQADVVRKLCGYLREGGYLFLGHSETFVDGATGYQAVIPSVFKKPAA